MKTFLEQRPCVVLFGNGQYTSALVSALNRDFDISPYIAAQRRPSLNRIFNRYRFTPLPYNELYIPAFLEHFTHRLDERRMILLIPCSPEAEKITDDHREFLETMFIVKSIDSLLQFFPSIKT